MANLYLNSVGGSDANSGASWALAKATMNGIAAIDAAGDVIYVASGHSESYGGNATYGFNGTVYNPSLVVCGETSAEPPTTPTSNAVCTATGALTISGNLVCHGIYWTAGSGSGSTLTLQIGALTQRFVDCGFRVASTAPNANLTIGSTASQQHGCVIWENCTYRVNHANQQIRLGQVKFIWNGGSVIGTVFPANLIATGGACNINVEINDVDFSGLAWSSSLVLTTNLTGVVTLRNCKLPASWNGAVINGTIATQLRVSMYNCDSGDTNYRMEIYDLGGDIRTTTATYRIGGATDGVTPIAWVISTIGATGGKILPLASDWIYIWNTDVGVSKTLTMEILNDGASLTDADIRLEVEFMGEASTLGSVSNAYPVPSIQSGTVHPSSSASWADGALLSPVKQKMTRTFTPAKAGWIRARAVVTRASAGLCYVCPKIELT